MPFFHGLFSRYANSTNISWIVFHLRTIFIAFPIVYQSIEFDLFKRLTHLAEQNILLLFAHQLRHLLYPYHTLLQHENNYGSESKLIEKQTINQSHRAN